MTSLAAGTPFSSWACTYSKGCELSLGLYPAAPLNVPFINTFFIGSKKLVENQLKVDKIVPFGNILIENSPIITLWSTIAF